MTLIRDLIAIPEQVHQGDFVLQLTKGVTEPEQTLRDCVVHPKPGRSPAPERTAPWLARRRQALQRFASMR
jgi:hypothetical protein